MIFFTVIRLLSVLAGILGLFMLLPGIVALASEDKSSSTFFFLSLAMSLSAGIVLYSTKRFQSELNNRSAFMVVTLSWLSACLVGALPYYLSGQIPSFVDSFFESASGFSGTGASILPNVELLSDPMLLWRSMTQWLGGMGIIVFFLALLPLFGIGGGQLYKAEVAGPQNDKITPRVRETAQKLWQLYLALTMVLCGILTLLGMSLLDAFCHAMATISTGGFSTKAAGIAAFNSPTIEWVIALFMLVGSINFALHFRLLLQRDHTVIFNTELKWYSTIILGMTLVFTLTLWSPEMYPSAWEALRNSFFTVVCTISSTGFTNHNYLEWGPGLQFLLLLLMVMGGMSGSTSGGSKCIRFVAAFKQITQEFVRVLHPRAVLRVKADEYSIPESVVNAIWGFLFIYLLIFAVVTALLCFQGLDMLSAGSATISALSNMGPAMGEIGPYDNYGALTVVSKVALIASMILGRLEFYTVLIIFTPFFWKK